MESQTSFNPSLKLLHYPEHLVSFIKGDLAKGPVQIEISPTNSCNASCPWCFYVSGEYKQRHSDEEIPWESLQQVLGELQQLGNLAVTWSGGGDPSVYSHIDDAIDTVHTLGMKQGIFTNAYKPLKHPEKLDWIRVTVTEKFVITKHVARYAQATNTGVNFNLCKGNEEYLPRMVKEARDAGCRYFQVRPALADRHDLQEPVECPTWLLDFETPSFRIVLTDYKWHDYLKPHGYPICNGHRFVPFLWHNGDLAVCAYHFDKAEYTFGNVVKEGGFKKVWEGSRRASMLQAGVKVINECQHCCKLHEINKPLASLAREADLVNHVEFL